MRATPDVARAMPSAQRRDSEFSGAMRTCLFVWPARLLYTTVSMSHAEKHGRSSHTAHRTSRVQRRSHAATRCLNTRAFERFVADSHLAFQSRVLTSLPDVFNAPDSLVDPNFEFDFCPPWLSAAAMDEVHAGRPRQMGSSSQERLL